MASEICGGWGSQDDPLVFNLAELLHRQIPLEDFSRYEIGLLLA